MTAPSPTFTITLTAKNKANAVKVIQVAMRIGKAGTAGDYTEVALLNMFLAATGALGPSAQSRTMQELNK
jgi:hypothetical protein